MIHQLHAAWRARRVLLIGGTDRSTFFMQTLLDELGARPALLLPTSPAEALHRAMTNGRVSAVIVPSMRSLRKGSAAQQLASLSMLLDEAREAGIPLVSLMSDDSVYRASDHPWHVREEDLLGGETPQGLIQSILDLFAGGAARGLCGDPVSTQCIRHLPCLGCGHSSVAQYDAWCRCVAEGSPVEVSHPAMNGIFVHPLDVCCGALLLGARFLLGDTRCIGAFNLGAASENIMPNRTAALRFIRRLGIMQSLCEIETPHTTAFPLPDSSKARLLCGARCLISGEDAFLRLHELNQAAQHSTDSERHETIQQTQAYLKLLAAQ